MSRIREAIMNNWQQIDKIIGILGKLQDQLDIIVRRQQMSDAHIENLIERVADLEQRGER